jgi:hypothetical protein
VISGKAGQFRGHVQAAGQSDELIEGNIAAYSRSPDPTARGEVLSSIQQALQFYTQLETRLNQLAAQRK